MTFNVMEEPVHRFCNKMLEFNLWCHFEVRIYMNTASILDPASIVLPN